MLGIDIVTSNKTFLFAGAALMLAAGLSNAAMAQSVSSAAGSNFKRDRNVSVSARPRPDYQAAGIHAGGFTVYPKLATTFEHNDNIYAAKTGKQDDTVWHINPEIDVASNWNRHFLSAYVRGGFNRYSDNSTENSDDYAVGADGRLDITRNTLAELRRLLQPQHGTADLAERPGRGQGADAVRHHHRLSERQPGIQPPEAVVAAGFHQAEL